MLESKMTVAMCFYYFMIVAGDNVLTVKRTEEKEVKNRFLKLSCDTP